jgi:hypothetical protein
MGLCMTTMKEPSDELKKFMDREIKDHQVRSLCRHLSQSRL